MCASNGVPALTCLIPHSFWFRNNLMQAKTLLWVAMASGTCRFWPSRSLKAESKTQAAMSPSCADGRTIHKTSPSPSPAAICVLEASCLFISCHGKQKDQINPNLALQALPRGSNVVPFWVVYFVIKKPKTGQNAKGTTFEPLGMFTLPDAAKHSQNLRCVRQAC